MNSNLITIRLFLLCLVAVIVLVPILCGVLLAKFLGFNGILLYMTVIVLCVIVWGLLFLYYYK